MGASSLHLQELMGEGKRSCRENLYDTRHHIYTSRAFCRSFVNFEMDMVTSLAMPIIAIQLQFPRKQEYAREMLDEPKPAYQMLSTQDAVAEDAVPNVKLWDSVPVLLCSTCSM